jgi:hypothetical protein
MTTRITRRETFPFKKKCTPLLLAKKKSIAKKIFFLAVWIGPTFFSGLGRTRLWSRLFWSVEIRNMDPSPSSSQLTGNSLVLAEADEPLLVENKVRRRCLNESATCPGRVLELTTDDYCLNDPRIDLFSSPFNMPMFGQCTRRPRPVSGLRRRWTCRPTFKTGPLV